MAGLFIVGGATFDSLASGAIVVVAVAVIGSVTVLPALLAKLGRWVDRPRVPLLWRLNRRIGQGGLSRRILAPVVRRPVAALGRLARRAGRPRRPGARHEDHDGNLDTLPRSIPEVQTLHALADAVPRRGHHGDGGRPRRRGPARPGRRCADHARDERRRHPVVRPRRARGDRDVAATAGPAADPADPLLARPTTGPAKRSSSCAPPGPGRRWATCRSSTPSAATWPRRSTTPGTSRAGCRG